MGFRKEMVGCGEWVGNRAWGGLEFLPRFVLALGRLWAKRINCLQNGDSQTPGV